MRNVEKTIAEGRKLYEKHTRAAMLTCLDFKHLEETEQGKMEAMHNAYLMGLAVGNRIGKRQGAAKV